MLTPARDPRSEPGILFGVAFLRPGRGGRSAFASKRQRRSARPVCRTAQRPQTILPTLRDMNRSLEDALEALGRVAAEIDEVATNWATVDEQAPGPALLRNWRAQIVFSLMVLREVPQSTPKLRRARRASALPHDATPHHDPRSRQRPPRHSAPRSSTPARASVRSSPPTPTRRVPRTRQDRAGAALFHASFAMAKQSSALVCLQRPGLVQRRSAGVGSRSARSRLNAGVV